MNNSFTKKTGILVFIFSLIFCVVLQDANAQERFALQNADNAKSISSVPKPPGNGFTLAPNPAKDILYAGFWSGEPTEYTVSIYTMIGNVLRSRAGVCQIGMNSALIDMTGFAPGAYLIQVNNHGVIYTGKILLL